jgi:hypothetical protein
MCLCTYNTFKNNIFSNQGKGYAFFMGAGSTDNILDNNDLFTKGKYLGATTTNLNILNLAAWQQETQNDLHSVSVDPFYLSATDLHARNIYLKQAGADIGTLLPVDLDAQLRTTSMPDVGAYNFSPVTADAGLYGFENASQVCEGTAPVKVKLKNGGSSTLNGITIKWSINNVAQPVFNGSNLNMASGKDTLITLGMLTYQPAISYTIKAWSENPNGVTDVLAGNDTTVAENLKTGLKGSYTIGGSNPDYATINMAVADLNDHGICGPVVFNIRNGIYKEQVGLNTVLGTGFDRTIVFQSESKNANLVTIVVDTTFAVDYLLRMRKINYTTFDHLTFKSVSIANTLVKVEEGCSFLIFADCIFKRESPYSGNCFNATKGVNTLILKSNVFDGSHTPVLISSGSAMESKDVNILKNTFQNYISTGLDFATARNTHVEGNTFLSTPASPSFVGISFRDQRGSFSVEKNYINGNQNGIILSLCTGDDLTRARVANNMINISNSYAIFMSGIENTNIVHNTFNNSDLGTNGTSAYDNGYNKKVWNLNNIYSHFGQGYSYRKDTDSDSAVVFNNNDYYAMGSKFVNWLGIEIATLADLKIASTQNAQSLSVDPIYISTTNLHIRDNNALLNSAGSTLPAIAVDIDDEVRHSPPDIGADEYVYNPPLVVGDYTAGSSFLQATPNPFSVSTTIHYTLEESSSITLEVYNSIGALVYTILQEKQHAGNYKMDFHPGSIGLGNGLYILKLNYGNKTSTLRIVQSN